MIGGIYSFVNLHADKITLKQWRQDMIVYAKKFLGLNILFRTSGSAIYKAAVPGIVSVLIVIFLRTFFPEEEFEDLKHPYGVGILISSVSFIIIFRANYGYQRHWEAYSAVHHMISKWLDATQHSAAFHLQSKHYNKIKPPNYFENDDLNELRLTRDRQLHEDVMELQSCNVEVRSSRQEYFSIETVANKKLAQNSDSGPLHDPKHLIGAGQLCGGWGKLYNDNSATYHQMGDDDGFWFQSTDGVKKPNQGFASINGGRTHSLFLQELIHLSSLVVAVAFSTLRNDVEGAISPLGFYTPGMDWPEADPSKLSPDVKEQIYAGQSPLWYKLLSFMGHDRSPQSRTQYNAARPMLVLGGVSKNEIFYLQKARGPSAKVTLAMGWLTEFIIREQLAGSLGAVGPPIISRLFQFLSDGMIYYNHGRKIMYTPFPFPHAQLTAFFIVVIIGAIPMLLNQYVQDSYIACFMTFLSVTCLSGLHEVARELENPFRNTPNDVPLCTFLAMYNESLITLYAGYHPDHYWNANEYRTRYSTSKLPRQPIIEEETPSAPQSTKPSTSMEHLQSLIEKQSKEIAKQAKELKQMKFAMKSE